MKFELDYIEKLAKLVSDNNLTELTLEDGEKAMVFKKEKEIITTTTTPFVAPVNVAAASPVIASAPAKKEAAPEAKMGTAITSPMVGTFYKASSPNAKPFVEVGQKVEKGQVVCIIEAMKLMNEIESEVSGTVLEICVNDGEPVEFGQTLMYVG